MAERPLLLLPDAVTAARGKKGGGGNGPAKLAAGRQQERLGPRLKELEASFEAQRVQLQTSAAGAVPEDVLVLDTAGTVEDFVKAVTRIEGFEFLAEYDEEDIPPDDDFFTVKGEERLAYTGRVYMVFAAQDAFQQLLRLWQLWQDEKKFDFGFAKWRDVFSLLRDIRPWGIKDRLEETGVLADWEERVALGEEEIPCEIELWFRANEQRRAEASHRIRERVEELRGTVLSEGIVPSIHYHGIAARLPIQAVQQLLDAQTRSAVRLVQSEQIQFLRAAGQLATRASGERRPSQTTFAGPTPHGQAVVALLDGLPLQRHLALDGRLRVDDPDGYESDYRADARSHGTAMASLIVWGDLNAPHRTPIPQPLYVRPIMRPAYPPAWTNAEPYEHVPEGVLVVDLVHRAVRRLFEGEGEEEPAAASIAVINLSIGILDRPFAGTLSPLARLIDWLAWKYGVLFVVSAGNHLAPVDTGRPWSELESLDSSALAAAIVQSVAADTRNRRVLSPAEAMNALTVGALHADEDAAAPHVATRIDPLPHGYPSPLNGHGLGYRRSIKPDLLLPGGRLQFERPVSGSETRLHPVRVAVAPGHEVAAPGATPGDVAYTAKGRGTSNATALLSRAAGFLSPAVAELRGRPGGSALASVSDGVVLKALLAHGARWGVLGAQLQDLFRTPENAGKLAEQLARLLGFGAIEIADVAECSKTRVTGIGGGTLGADAGAEHRFPLPPSLSGKRGWRRLTVTLAWFTPVNPVSHRWRRAHLWFESPKSKLTVGRVGPDWQAAQRGTLQHDTFQGDSASAFVDGDDIVVRVSCREDAPGLDVGVPYALAVTLEVAKELGVDVYAEIRERINARALIAAGVRARN